MERQYIGKADGFVTCSDEQHGYTETRKRLKGYSDSELQREYLNAQRDGFNRMFGHNARKFGNLVVDELLAREITCIANMFGDIPVTRFSR